MIAAPFYPAAQLSIAGNHDEFGIPVTPLGDAICGCRIVWGWVAGELQPCILHKGVHYPGFVPATAKEVYDEA